MPRKAKNHTYYIIKYDISDGEDGEEISAIISSSWFDDTGSAVKSVRIPKNNADNGEFLIKHKKPTVKGSVLIKGYDVIQNFDDLVQAKIFFKKMQQDEEIEKEADNQTETSSDEDLPQAVMPPLKNIKLEYNSLLLKAQEKVKTKPPQKANNEQQKESSAITSDIEIDEQCVGSDDRLVSLKDLKIFEKKILSYLQKSENKIHSEVHNILMNLTQFSSKCFEEIENMSNPNSNNNARQAQHREKFPFPLKSWDDLIKFCEFIENDANFREMKVKQMEIYAAMGSSIDEKRLKKTFRQFLKALTTSDLRLAGNFAGRCGNGKLTRKVPEAFMAFIKECFRLSGIVSAITIEENIKKAWNQTGDTIRKMKRRDVDTD